MCVIQKSPSEPVTREDMGVEITPSALPVNIIMDGRVMSENIKLTGIDERFINNCLKRVNVKNYKDILLFTLDNNGKVFIQAKNSNNYLTFQSSFSGGERW